MKDVYYKGTEEEWSEISIGDGNEYLTNATIHFNSTGAELLSLSPQSISINAAGEENPFENLAPDTIYNVYVFVSKDTGNLLDAENLLYIMQFRTDKSGNIAALDMPDGEISVVGMKAPEVEETALMGDVNNDTIINLKDVVLLRRYIAGGWNVEVDETVADVNKDGKVDLKDTVLLRRYISGGWNVELA